jgi:hypothetical protein
LQDSTPQQQHTLPIAPAALVSSHLALTVVCLYLLLLSGDNTKINAYSSIVSCNPAPAVFLQAGIFQYAKQITDAQAGESVVDTVVVVPAWFGVAQRQAVIDAASLAGLNVLGLMNGHAAAALQFGIERDFAKKEQTVRVPMLLCSRNRLSVQLVVCVLQQRVLAWPCGVCTSTCVFEQST